MKNTMKPLAALLAMALAPALATAHGDGDRSSGAHDSKPHKMKSEHAGHAAAAMSDQSFLDHAYASGRKEVLAARLAQKRASHDKVRDFASMVERDRRELNKRLEKAGADTLPPHPNDAAVGDHVARNVEEPADTHPSVPPAEMSDDYVKAQLATFPKMQPLLDAQGREFDRTYVKLQLDKHRKAIATFEAVANGANNSAEVKKLARDSLDTLRQHMAVAEALSATLDSDMASTAGSDR